jgi:2,4-dienoyl-CoA reductase-like NADH-dependent reductase (Old Yellow Enzyme family)
VIAEATAVEAVGRISPHDLGLYREEHIEPLARITRFLGTQNTVAGVQLAHAGRKASTDRPWLGGKPVSDAQGGWQPIGPSPVAFDAAYRVPTEIKDPSRIAGLFRDAAGRALRAGFRLVEIHAAHGYLLHEFHSPLSNRRTDSYGGTFDNRVRLTIETVRAVRQVWPESLPLWVRLSCTDWTEGGWTLEESVELARRLKGEGVDTIDCSSGGNVPHAKIPVGPGYQVPFAAAVREKAGIATAAVGMITTPPQAEGIVAEGKADFVLIARESLRDPNFPIRAARELGAEPPAPVQYLRAV